MNDMFNLSNFNIIEDEEYYYFFRALNNEDYTDINEGIMVYDGKLQRIRTDLSRYKEKPLYSIDSTLSLEEVYDHIKWRHRKDTNCISLTTNANVAATYGKGNYHNQYAMISVPKNAMKENDFFLALEYMIDEINNRINSFIDSNLLTDIQKEYLTMINNASSNDELFEVLTQYFELLNNSFNDSKYYDLLTLNDEQNLEKNKIIAKVDIVDKKILPICNNRLLLEALKFAITSSEIIHYKEIDKNLIELSPTTIDLFSILQQAKSRGLDQEKIKKLELKVLECSKNEYKVNNNKYGKYNTNLDSNLKVDSNFNIKKMFELTNGKISFYRAYNAYIWIQNIIKSKLETDNLCELLKEIANDPSLDSFIDDIKNECYVIEPEFVSRNLNEGTNLSDSVFLSMNSKDGLNFTLQEQNSVLELIKKMSISQMRDFLNNGLTDDIKNIFDLIYKTKEDEIYENRYYAETIVDFLDLDSIYSNSIRSRRLTKEEKETLISYLDKANCINMYNILSTLNYNNKEISGIIFNLLMSNGYQGLSFIDLSNSEEFANIISNNTIYINSEVSAIKLDYLLGISDNNNHVLQTDLILRDYQQLAVSRIEKIFEEKNFAGVVLPTGAGKSFVAIAEMLKYNDKNILYYAPNRPILNQLQKHIVKHVLGKSIISETQEQYYRENPSLIPDNFIFESDISKYIELKFPHFKMYCYQGLTTKDDAFFEESNAGLIILDEVHRTGATEWKPKIQKLLSNNPGAKILGITATPVRDVDQQNMIDKLAELCGTYTKEEITKNVHLASEMYLVDAIQQNIVVSPNIVTFDYSLGSSEEYQDVKTRYENETNPAKREELKQYYEEMRDIVQQSKNKGMASIIKEGFINNNKPFNGRYIIFLPRNNGINHDTEEYIKEEIERVKSYFKDIDPNPDVEYLLSTRSSKKDNDRAIKRFENDSDHLKLLFAIDMLNEGVHVDGIDGCVMLRPLGAGNKILYYQQIGRCIFSLDPNHELEPSELPVIFDVYNNYLEQNIDRQVNRHSISSDLQRLISIENWISKHFRYPDVNSDSLDEARKAITIKNIQKKYKKYLVNPVYSDTLTDREIYQIEQIINIGSNLSIWNIDFGVRIKDPLEDELKHIRAFTMTAEQGRFLELYEKSKRVSTKEVSKNTRIRLQDALNILDLLSEYGLNINSYSIPYNSTLKEIIETFPKETKDILYEEIDLPVEYPIGKEYEYARFQFYKKHALFMDYDFSILKKMGIFIDDALHYQLGRKTICDDNGFIKHGPVKFKDINKYTGTYYGPNGLNVYGLDENNFDSSNSFVNIYHFDRDGFYYELDEDGNFINTGRKLNPYNFDMYGFYYEVDKSGNYVNTGRKIDDRGFDIDKIYHKYNEITKKYVSTKYKFDDRGFNIDGIFCSVANIVSKGVYEITYSDDITRVFEKPTYEGRKNNTYFIVTDLPYDINYFDRDGYYWELKDGERVKTNRKYNDSYLDCEGNYWALIDGVRVKTKRKYDDRFYDIEGYYWELKDGKRVRTNNTSHNGYDRNGIKPLVIIGAGEYSHSRNYGAYDIEGYFYEYIGNRRVKVEPPTKINKFGFDADGFYHELLEDGTRDINPSTSKFDKHGFDCHSIHISYYKLVAKEKGIDDIDKLDFSSIVRFKEDFVSKNNIRDIKDENMILKYLYPNLNENNFDQSGNYWEISNSNDTYFVSTDKKYDRHGFNIDKLFEYVDGNGKTRYKKYNKEFFDIDGYYWKLVKNEDGTSKRVKTKKKFNPKGYNIDRLFPDIYINTDTNEFIYKDFKPFNKKFFDADGYYWAEKDIFTRLTPEQENQNFKWGRYKTDFKHDNYGFMQNGIHIKTNEVYDLNFFGADGYYYETMPDGNIVKTERLYDKNNFDRDGYYYIKQNGNMKKISRTYDNFDFSIKDYNEADKKRRASEEEIDDFGFDKNGYYHELMDDNTRSKTPTSSRTNNRGFDCYGHNQITMDLIDKNGFDYYGDIIISRSEEKEVTSKINLRGFDADGNYYIKTEDGYKKTDRKVDENGFDIDGYFYKEVNGDLINTHDKYNENGFDIHGFDKNGKHSVTKLKYDENYFDASGINVITGTNYSITGYTIDNYYNYAMKQEVRIKDNIVDFAECLDIATKYISLPFDERKEFYDSISEPTQTVESINNTIYQCIIIACVISDEFKKRYSEYILQKTVRMKEIKEKIKTITEEGVKYSAELNNLKLELASLENLKKSTKIGGKR